MQPYKNLIVVLPCHSLEDFPIHHRGDDAEDLLANWTALWHPALITGSGQKPNWQQADNPDVSSSEQTGEGVPELMLALIPHVAKSMLSSELESNLESAKAIVLSKGGSREKIVSDALAGNTAAAELAAKVDAEIAADFYALGYGFLQVQIMTRQLRYSSNLDESYFSDAVVAAAKHATDGDHDKAKEGLVRCFDLLLDEKNGYYPVEPELLDIVLTAPTTLGANFAKQLETDHPTNILMTGVVCDTLANRSSESLEKLKQRIADERVCVIGGLEEELPEPLVSSESTLNQLSLGRATFMKHLGVEPSVFMRRRFGLHSSLPGILEQFNFVGAVHSTLDDGTFPRSSNCTIRWTGDDDRSLLAVGDLPLSASEAGSFVGLGVRLGEAIDSAHVAAAVFVHWPGDACESFHDLVRITNYGPLFGSFTGLEEYFETVYDPGYGDSFNADEYKSPFLKQAVERQTLNPISKYTSYWKRFYQLAACRSLLIHACASAKVQSAVATEMSKRIDAIQGDIETEVNAEHPNAGSRSLDTNSLDSDPLDEHIQGLTAEIKRMIEPQGNPAVENVETFLINPTSTRRRVDVSIPSKQKGTLRKSPPVVVGDIRDGNAHLVVEIQPMGRTNLNLGSLDSSDLLKSDPRIGEGLTLRNEFFELKVDENTGGLRSIQLYEKRINLASQQLAIRIPAMDSPDLPLTKARYTTMVAKTVELEMESRLAGGIVSKGQLMDGSKVLADFTQSARVVRGMPMIELDIGIDLKEPLTQSVNHYVCSRLAWKNETSRVNANAGEIRQEVNSDWFRATNFMEVVQEKHRLTMMTGGLPFHRRVSRRMVDSLLIVGGEQSRRFKLGLGVNVSYPFAAAINRLTPPINLELLIDGASPNSIQNSSSWLFHFNCKNILATWWEPFFDKDGNWAGVHIRLRETEGRAGKLAVRCPRIVASGEQVNFGGDFLQSLEVAADDPSKLELEFGRFDFFQISIRWKI